MNNKHIFYILTITLIFSFVSNVYTKPLTYPQLGAPYERKVDVAWNRYYDLEGMQNILEEIHEAHPELTELYSIGQSHLGNEIWCLEVTNKNKGDAKNKPGMYIDGNIHGNEIQASEVVLYTAWYLTENYNRLDRITQLLDEKVFYLIPTINPDGREAWFTDPQTPHSSRTGLVPYDNDNDGLVDEDGYDDLNNDGEITMMRIKDPNGRYKPHPDYPEYLMIQVEHDERGEYRYLGFEGIDNDGDGEINEDGPGGYDSNRNWGYDWQPNYVQYGAHHYPFSLPNTKAVADFVVKHPNIAAMQSYHNFGGMILRPPGREGGVYDGQDDALMRDIAARGVKMLPEYRSLVIATDLYTVWGGEIDWFYGARGIMSFTNELWTLKNMFRNDETSQEARIDFARHLLFNDGLVKWEEYEHPTYGTIEVGGMTKELYRIPPSFLLEEECHRNMAFTLYHAESMPLISFGETEIEELDDNLYKVWIEVKNENIIPTRLNHDVKNEITKPDVVTVKGDDITVLSSGIVTDQYFKRVKANQTNPQRVLLPNVPGLDSQRIQFIISGEGTMTVSVDSTKGGLIQRDVELP